MHDGPFDPYQMMVNRKRVKTGETPDISPVQEWPEADVKKLEEFCKKHGIVGFNCGRMSPLAALALLKNHLGIPTDIQPSEGFGPNYPYSEAMKKKVLLSG